MACPYLGLGPEREIKRRDGRYNAKFTDGQLVEIVLDEDESAKWSTSNQDTERHDR